MAAFGRPPYTFPPEQFNKGGLWPPAKPVFLMDLRPPANDQHIGRMAIVLIHGMGHNSDFGEESLEQNIPKSAQIHPKSVQNRSEGCQGAPLKGS